MLVFLCCEATGALECMFWEILLKLPELQSTENVAEDGILWSGCNHEGGQLQSDNKCQQGIYAWLRGVDLPGDLPIWALIVNIWTCHSDQLADVQGGDLPGDLLNFWQDRVDPISTWNMQFLDISGNQNVPQ